MSLQDAQAYDASDPLKEIRKEFLLPEGDVLYFCTNSLGLPARRAEPLIEENIKLWKQWGAEGWFHGESNWYTSIDPLLRRPLAHILGSKYDEVVVMNSLTVNLHLLLYSFYNPSSTRYKILMEAPFFPSDLYAIKSHLQLHGQNPEKALILVGPGPEGCLEEGKIEHILEQQGEAIALVFLNPVHYLTGQVLEMERVAKVAKEKGCILGLDIAHAAGNIPLYLHAWEVDFAVGCSYKYLCSGPGGPGIAYVHEKHHEKCLPRLSGWWGNDPKKRFLMHLQPEFHPFGGAASWQVSTPGVLALLPLLASLEIFEKVGLDNLRKKSLLQTKLLLELLRPLSFDIITPQEPARRGAQISLRMRQSGDVVQHLKRKGIICDFRPPDILRLTPSPLYTTFEEIYRLVDTLLDMTQEMNSRP